MYVKSIKGYFFFSSVLVAGLTSCSADKSSEAPVDPWPRPKISIVKNGKASAYGKLDQIYTTADSVKFDFEDQAMSNSVRKVDVQSSCYSDSLKEGSNFNYSIDGSQFKFLDVISEELLAKADKDLTCLFTLKITNEHGSTKSFDIDLKLRREKEDLLKLNFPNSAYVPQPLYAPMMKLVRFNEDLPDGTLSLICSSFRSASNNSAKNFSELALGSSNTKDDPRISNPKQNCRIIFRAADGQRSVSLTPLLNFDFGSTPLEITTKVVAQNFQAFENGNTPLQTFFITNHGDVPASVAFPMDNSLFATTTLLYTAKGNGHGLKVGPMRLPMSFELLGTRTMNAGKLSVATIGPHQRIEVSLKLAIPRCKPFKVPSYVALNAESGEAIGMVTFPEETNEIKMLTGLIYDDSTKLFQAYEESKLWNLPREFVQSWNPSVGLNKNWLFITTASCP